MILATGKNKAFSLIELMVTVVIVSVGLIFILRAYGVCSQYLRNIRERMGGVLILGDLLGEIRAQALKAEDETAKSRSGRIKVGEREFKWVKEVSKWEVPPEGGFTNLLPPEDESEADSGLALVDKKITQVEFRLNWEAGGKGNQMKLKTLIIQ